MTSVPVWVEQTNGTFTARVLGATGLAASAATRDQAVSALVADLTARQTRGELLMVTVPSPPEPALTAVDEELWDELVAGVYRDRDEEKSCGSGTTPAASG